MIRLPVSASNSRNSTSGFSILQSRRETIDGCGKRFSLGMEAGAAASACKISTRRTENQRSKLLGSLPVVAQVACSPTHCSSCTVTVVMSS